jgi:sphinganine-1-phosphate aldolase
MLFAVQYSHPKYRHYQWFTVVDWPGGVYATSNIGGSRAGGIVAACWASLVNYGRQGYIDCTRKVVATTKYIAEQLATIPGIKIIGVPEVSVVAIGESVLVDARG